MTQLEVVRRAAFVTMPWKNGGGITHEVRREPPAAGAAQRPFTWRVSIAEIAMAGPFSAFPGHTRTLVLLGGQGMELRFAGDRCTHLHRIGEWVEFDGALATECRLLGGPCTDLNLMVSKACTVEARVCPALPSSGMQASPDATVLMMGLTAPLALVDEAGATTRLEPWELGVLWQGRVQIAAAQDVFVATVRGKVCKE